MNIQQGSETSRFALFERYAEKIRNRVARSAVSFKTHLFSFAMVNAGLALLWGLTGGGHPWFLYPLGAWGIGIAHHFTHYRNVKRAARQISVSHRMPEKRFRLFRRQIRLKAAFSQHATAVASVSAYLCMINIITGVSFQWWLIPAAAMGIGLGIHSIPHQAGLRSVEEQLSSEGVAEGGQVPLDSTVLKEAQRLETHIRRELKTAGVSVESIKQEMLPALETFLKGIEELSRKKQEIQEVLLSHPKDSIRRERLMIEDKIEHAASPALRAEYTKAAEGLVRHEETVSKLEERRELIDLRLQGSLQSLRQLQLDLARLKTSELSSVLEHSALEELRRKSEEMTAYIEDLDTGYSELT